MVNDSYDLVVVGGGPAGYHAAIRGAQLGFSTVCIERWRTESGENVLGGTCLNVGCIPTKTLLDVSHKFDEAQNRFGDLGIRAQPLTIDVPAMMKRKDQVVGTLTKGVAGLFTANGVETLWGTGRVEGAGRVAFESHDGSSATLAAGHIVIATGSVPAAMPNCPYTGDRIVDSTGALEFADVPGRLGIIGAGVIGLELGSIWRRLGSEVVVLELLEEFLPPLDRQIAKECQRQMKRQGLDIRLGVRVTEGRVEGDDVVVTYQDGDDQREERFSRLIVAVGRKPFTDNVLAPGCGVELDERGFIRVDDLCRTTVDGIYAVGDVVRGPMLAHKGMAEGVMVAENIAGEESRVNYPCVPGVIYTNPEVAWVGEHEEQLRAAGREVKSGTFPFSASGRALAADSSAGLVKVIADAETDRILGVHMIGPQASEMIAEAVIAMEFGASAEDVDLTMFAHPTLSESFHEASLALGGKAIHIPNRERGRK